MNIQQYKFKIESLSALLTNNPQSMGKDTGTMKTKKKYVPEEEAAQGLYINEKKQFCIPAIAFRSALIKAVTNKKVGKKSAASIMAAAVFNMDAQTSDEEILPILDKSNMKPVKTYGIDSRRAIVVKQGIIRHRPKFSNWACIIPFQIDTDLISPEVVAENLNEAGTIIGVGDYRVEKKGWFGRFKAELIK
jgi:hypothetical protein